MDKARLPRNLGEKDKNKKCPYFGDITHFEYNRGILCRYFLESQGNTCGLDHSQVYKDKNFR